MADTAAAEPVAAVETPAEATPAPVGELNSLADYRARRSEVDAPPKPVETAEAEAEAEDDGEEKPVDPKASEAGKQLAAKKKSLQGRIDEITAEKHMTAGELAAARREIAELRAEMASLRSGKPAEAEKPEPAAIQADPDDPEPTLERDPKTGKPYEDYHKWLADAARWNARQEHKAQRATEAKRAHADGLEQAQNRVAAAGVKAHEDFDAVVSKYESEGGDYNEVATDVIARHPLGHEFAYAMAKDPALAKAINKAPNLGASLFEAGRLIARLEGEAVAKAKAAEKPAEEKPVRLSKAPAPVQPQRGGDQVPSTRDADSINSLEEWRRVKKQRAAA